MADNRKAAITAKVSMQCAEFYKKALSYLESSKASTAFGSSQTKVQNSAARACYAYTNVKVFFLYKFG